MRKIISVISPLLLFFWLLLITTGCQTAQAPAPVLTTITVSPEAVSIVNGATQQFYATCKDQDGNTMEDQIVTWEVSGDIGSISDTGLFTASYSSSSTGILAIELATGEVRAIADSVTGSSNVTINSNTHSLTIACAANTYIDSYFPSTIFYTSNQSESGYWYSLGCISISYLKYDVSAIPSYASITSAKLKLYIANVIYSGGFYYYNIASTWDETTLCYNYKPPTTGTSVASKSFLTTDSGWIEIDITDCVQNWVDGTTTNNGLAMYPQSLLSSAVIRYYSKASTTNKPKLEIVAEY